MRVLVVLHTPKSPHSAVYVGYQHLAADLAARGHSATVLAPQDFAMLRRLHGRWYALLYPFCVAGWLARHAGEYDLAVFHSYAGWVANLVRPRRVRTITAFHGLEPLSYRAVEPELRRAGCPYRLRFRLVHGWLLPMLMKGSCRRSGVVLCLNQEERSYLIEHGWGDETTVEIVGRGIAPEFFLTHDYAPRARRLLFVAQWNVRKGTRYLVQALEELAARVPDLHLHCLGTLVPEDQVLAAFPPGCRDRVTVRSRLDQHELPDQYRTADIFIFPSIIDAFGRALLEAMATATPIVTTPTGLAPDALRHEESCLLVPKADARALRDAVLRLIDDGELRARLGRAAQRAARRYESGRVSEHLLSIFARVLEAA